jgi:hypothetical protein
MACRYSDSSVPRGVHHRDASGVHGFRELRVGPMAAVKSGSFKALAASGPRRKLLDGVANCQPNSRLASFAMLLHILATLPQCGYNAIDGRGQRKPLTNP